MKPSLMSPLAWRHSAVNTQGVCPRLGVQDATARPWSTSIKSHSPPAGRYVHLVEHRLTVLLVNPLRVVVDEHVWRIGTADTCWITVRNGDGLLLKPGDGRVEVEE